MSLFSSQPLGHLLLPQDFSHPLFRVKYQLLINDWQTVLWTCNIFDKERYTLQQLIGQTIMFIHKLASNTFVT